MDRDGLVSQILFRLGNRAGLKTLAESTVETVKVELEQDIFHPHFLLSENQYYETVAAEARIPVPSKMLAEYENGALWVEVDGCFRMLRKTTPDQWADRSSGVPTHYARMGQYFRLFPTPDKNYLLRTFNYVGTDLLTNISNPWLEDGSAWLIWSTVSIMAQSARDKNWSSFEARALSAKQSLMAKSEEMDMVNFEFSMGEL